MYKMNERVCERLAIKATLLWNKHLRNSIYYYHEEDDPHSMVNCAHLLCE